MSCCEGIERSIWRAWHWRFGSWGGCDPLWLEDHGGRLRRARNVSPIICTAKKTGGFGRFSPYPLGCHEHRQPGQHHRWPPSEPWKPTNAMLKSSFQRMRIWRIMKNQELLLKGPLQVCHSLWMMSWYLIDITSSADDVFPSDHSTKKTRYHYGGREIPHNYGELPKVVHLCLFHGWNWYRRKTRFYAIAEVSLVFLKKSASAIHTLRQINYWKNMYLFCHSLSSLKTLYRELCSKGITRFYNIHYDSFNMHIHSSFLKTCRFEEIKMCVPYLCTNAFNRHSHFFD